MGSRGGGGSGANNGISTIPSASRKMVQSLKEIVNCPEQEIYAALKDCNMDPNEAVNRLLSQDPFHEVKSKREKKKESKDTTDSRSRGGNGTSNRGGRSGAGRSRASMMNSSEFSSLHGKPPHKKENGAHAYMGSSSYASSMPGNDTTWQIAHYSESPALESKGPGSGENDFLSSSGPPSLGMQRSWGAPGQVSMADIVKMGRPQVKSSGVPNQPGQYHVAPPSATSHSDFYPVHDQFAKLPKSETFVQTSHNVTPDDDWPVDEEQAPSPNDDWPPFEQSSAAVSSVSVAPMDSSLYSNPSNLPLDRSGQHSMSQLDDGDLSEDGPLETDANHAGFSSVSSRVKQGDDTAGSSLFDKNMYDNMASFQAHMHVYEQDEVEGVAAVAANMQQLSLQKKDEAAVPEEDGPAVVIPDHLQVHTSDCQHLSFGSFGAGVGIGVGPTFSGSLSSRSMKSDLAEAPQVAADTSSIPLKDDRNIEHYGDEHLRPTQEGDDMQGTASNVGKYDTSSPSQTEVLKQEVLEPAPGNQYTFPSSTPDYSYENSQQLNAAFSHSQASTQLQNLSPFSNVLPGYSSSLPSTLLASAVQSGRESDLTYLPFPVTQSMATKYSNPTSVSSSIISSTEAFRTVGSASQQSQQNPPTGNLATGPSLPQHLTMHPYSQPTLPLAHFANMVGYPFLPQSFSYMPSAFQQAFAGNSTYHQSLAAVLPQHKNSLSVSSLPQSGAIAPGYGFGNSTSIPGGNFPLNPTATPTGTTIGYDDALSSQYKDANHLSLQQNENTAMWVHGAGSRTMSAVPGNTYYSFQGQSQQPGSLRQAQQPSQQVGALGYPNFYQSAGISLEHQQQIAREGSLSGSQGPQPKQSTQLWHNTY